MKRNFGGIKIYNIVIFGLIIFLFILLGTFFDLKIDESIYSPNNFYANIFEYLGTLPASIVLASSGVLLYYYLEDKKIQNKIKNFNKYLLIFITVLVGVLWGYDAFHRHIDNLLISVLIGIVVISFTNALFMRYLKNNSKKEEFLKKALVIIICGSITFALTYLLKGLVVRPRYMGIRLYLDNDTSYFRPWYEFSNKLDDKLIYLKENVSSYYLQSWPSGHSSFASLVLLGLIYYDVKNESKYKQLKLFIFFISLMLLIGISRLTDGHHYLSDIGFGYLIGLLPMSIGFIIAYKKKKVIKNKITNEQN